MIWIIPKDEQHSSTGPVPQAFDRVLIDTGALHHLIVSLPTANIKEDFWCNTPLHKAKTSVIIKTANTLAFRKLNSFNKFPKACKYWHSHDPNITFNPGTFAKALSYAMNSGDINDMIKDSVLALWHHWLCCPSNWKQKYSFHQHAKSFHWPKYFERNKLGDMH